jgi:4a-hydroxytetrahydrobiopterin dehydratase
MSDLAKKTCQPCNAGTPPVPPDEVRRLLGELGGWASTADGKSIERRFEFADYYETRAFVNAVAWMAHREDHHPDLEVSYKTCLVRYATHAVGGLSENDFICAAKVDELVASSA